MDITPHKITQPFQLLAAWLTGMVVLVGEFIYLTKASQEIWLKIASFAGAILLSLIFIYVIFILQTKYRPEMQDSEHYQEIWMENRKRDLNRSVRVDLNEVLKKWKK